MDGWMALAHLHRRLLGRAAGEQQARRRLMAVLDGGVQRSCAVAHLGVFLRVEPPCAHQLTLAGHLQRTQCMQ